MRYFPFKTPDQLPLADFLRGGLRFFFIEADKFARPYALHIQRNDGLCVKLGSFVYEIAPREEVGSLLIEFENGFPPGRKSYEFPEEFRAEVRFSQLNITLEDAKIACGLALIGRSSAQMIVVPGEMPYSIHVESSFFTDSFKPEFNLADYHRSNADE